MTQEDFLVVHLSTGHLGGAGLASRRLNAKLNEAGINSKFYALNQSNFTPNSNEYSIERSYFKRLISALFSFLGSRLSSKIFFSLISISTIPKDFKNRFPNRGKTIIHIHNWFNLLNLKEITKLHGLGYPVVVTMHDQRIMTGGCHYSLGCNHFESDCSECPLLQVGCRELPKLVHKNSSLLLHKMNNSFALVAPSKWMLLEAKKSSLLKDKTVVFIPNTLDANVPLKKHELNSNNLKVKLGIASMNSRSYVKGGDITRDLEIEIKRRDLPFTFVYMNSFPQDINGLSDFWSNIDYLVVLSRAENSPNVIHEAKQIGIPVIATKIGGITELLDDNFDIGIDQNELNVESILEKLLLISKSQSSESDRMRMQNAFRLYSGSSVTKHIDLYTMLTSESKNR
jgi:glycosyltransferase involved in cell wall biosynthesis